MRMNSKKESFIIKCVDKYGDQYDYTKFIYTNNKTKSIIICRIHGDFLKRPDLHINGQGCPKCSKESLYNKDIFISKSSIKHNNRYNYSLVNYLGSFIPVEIICNKHGSFKQLPSNHLQGNGCPKCSTESSMLDNSEFINRSNMIHNNYYNYNKTRYNGVCNNVTITCLKHGDFIQKASNHLSGKGCVKCSNTYSPTLQEFILNSKLVHGDKYDYSQVIYINNKSKVKIICDEHGLFLQSPNRHLSGNGCPKCSYINLSNLFKSTREDYIQKAVIKHNNLYKYDSLIYKGSSEKGIITCDKHGDFSQNLNNHLNGAGCPMCKSWQSKGEIELSDFIKSLGIDVVNNSRKIIGDELDIFIPEYNIAIEYDGEYWHSTANRGAKNGYLKYLKCLDNNISLFTFRDSEWKSKKEIIKSVLVNKFGKSKTNLYARKCEIKLVDKFSKSKFLVDNHLQGKCGSSIDLGLYYENILVSIMTFGKRRKNMGSSSKDDEYELIRFCTKLNISVIGGASKLLKHFIKNYKPNIIVTFANNRWSDGGLYEKIGFNFSHNSKPSYKYLVNNVLKDRFNYRKDVLVKEGFDESKTEFEIMDERGFPRLYDCGNKVYKLNLVEDNN